MQRRPLTTWALKRHLPADGLHSVLQPKESGTEGRVGPAETIVTDGDPKDAVSRLHLDVHEVTG